MKSYISRIFLLICFLIFISEIFFGYRYYIKRNYEIYGNYLPASFFVTKNFIKKIFPKKNEQKITETLIKKEDDCKILKNEFIEFEVSNFKSMRSPLKLGVTNAKFLNINDFDDKYLISFIGNSEGLGTSTPNHEDKIFHILEQKLNEKYQTNKIIVINLSNIALITHDMVYVKNIARNLYPIQLEIIYTGGNEANDIHRTLDNKIRIHSNNEFYYEMLNTNDDNAIKFLDKCADTNIYKNSSSFKEDYLINNIKNEYNKMLSTNNDDYDFLFYIHPFNQKIGIGNKRTLKLISKINSEDKRFKNLSLLDKKLNYTDFFHTTNGSEIAELIFDDIVNLYGNKIEKKINHKNN